MDQKLHARKKNERGILLYKHDQCCRFIGTPCLRQKQMSSQYNKQPWGENRQTWGINQSQRRSVPRVSAYVLARLSLRPRYMMIIDDMNVAVPVAAYGFG